MGRSISRLHFNFRLMSGFTQGKSLLNVTIAPKDSQIGATTTAIGNSVQEPSHNNCNSKILFVDDTLVKKEAHTDFFTPI